MFNILNKPGFLYLPGVFQELADKISMSSGINHRHYLLQVNVHIHLRTFVFFSSNTRRTPRPISEA